MSVTLTIPGLSDDENAIANALLAQLNDRKPRNLLRATYYDNKRSVRQVGTVIPPQYFRLGIVLGWTGKAVDQLARRCNLESMTWADGDLDSLGYQEFRDANALQATVKSGEVASLIHGPSWLINTTGGQGEPRSLLHAKDALSATGFSNARKRRLDSLLSVHDWSTTDSDRPTSFSLYLPDLTITCEDDGGWSVEKQEHRWGVPAEPMVYKPHTTSRDFGTSRISRPMMALQDRAVMALIRLEGHMDVYSYPEFWMLGADESVFKDAAGNIKPEWQVRLGRIKGLPDDEDLLAAGNNLARADVKQFAAQSPEPHLADLNALAKMFAREADLPDSSLAISDVANPTSADSYIESRESLIAEAEGCTDDWSLPVRRAVVRGLAIQEGLTEIPKEWSSIAPIWRSPIYTSRAAAADAGAKQIGSVPWLADTSVGLELLGLTPAQAERAMAERRRVSGRAAIAALVADGQPA